MTHQKLIQELKDENYLETPSIIQAFEKVDRKDFVPKDQEEYAYLNSALPIGHKQTISQPLVVAFMLELLEPKRGEKILDIGSGSGWQTALLAHIVEKDGKIIAIERIPELAQNAKANLADYPKLLKRIEMLDGDASKGFEQNAPYDKIISVASARKIPNEWKEQLKIGGHIVAPVRESIIRLEKTSADKFKKKEFYGFAFVPLISKQH
ncbi:protein-L-isoaspartate O-methyltransferase [bacterium]|nr:protein-L-isoaspartate O-methyltransferase [bacterium]|tara:strand:- start:2690 stop:3316 length:627 start_codon:yes stop_codon:yes gene_type:complete